jgi:hypothetical protein
MPPPPGPRPGPGSIADDEAAAVGALEGAADAVIVAEGRALLCVPFDSFFEHAEAAMVTSSSIERRRAFRMRRGYASSAERATIG